MLAFAFHNEFGVPATVTRFFNTTGPRQSSAYGMVVPSFVRAALAGQPLLVHGDGTQSRCFCHVSDTVRALMLLSEADSAAGEVYNVGSTDEITMLELAELTIGLVGELCPNVVLAEPATRLVPYAEAYNIAFEDTPRRVPSIDRLHALTGWKHSLSIEQIVKEMIRLEIAQQGAAELRDPSVPLADMVVPEALNGKHERAPRSVPGVAFGRAASVPAASHGELLRKAR
jgi:UDP-glucose 4-epimerase